MPKKILVLGYNDNPADGHALSAYKLLKEQGHDVCFLSLFSRYTNDTSLRYYFKIPGGGLNWLKYCLFRIKRRLYNYTHPNDWTPGKEKEYCLFNINNFFPTNADEILKKSIPDPEVIVIGWADHFISPKMISDLYEKTKAHIVVRMADAHIIGGGCHFPCDCQQYKTGCKSCPAVKNKRYAAELFNEKSKYFTNIPFSLTGVPFDLERAKETPYLSNKNMIPWVGTPIIPFVKSKAEARKELNIPENDFVIMSGSAYITEKRKGFHFLEQAMRQFSSSVTGARNITFLQLGKLSEYTVDLGANVNIIRPGYLDLNGLFTAYYASDVFCNTPIDDSGPYMVNYSIACGTPVLSFPIGIATSLVKHGETGYMAKYLDVDDLAKGLLEFYSLSEDQRFQYSQNCCKLMDGFRSQIPWYKQI